MRKATKELWFLRNPKIEESFLAMAIMGIVIIHHVTMLKLWTDVLFHLLAAGKSVFYTPGALFGQHQEGSAALVSNGKIQVLQFAILGLGIVGSLCAARKIAHRRYLTLPRRHFTLLPITALIVVLAALNVAMFLFPMAHRM